MTIFGPNLNDQSKGQFHVHAEGCAHGRNYGRRGRLGGERGWTVEVGTKLAVCAAVYADHLGDLGLTEDDDAGVAILADWLSDFHFAPCLKGVLA